jgi:hypothetical protein
MEKITIEIDKDLDMATYTLNGELLYSELRAAVVDYYNGKLTKYTIWDFSESNLAQYISSIEAIELASLVDRLGKARPGGVDLIIISGLLQYGIARIYTLYADATRHNPSLLRAMVFRDKNQALKWLRNNAGKT